MKKMLFAGAVLMIGASIYGFVDYKKASQKNEFKNLYAEKQKEPLKDLVTDTNKVETEKADLDEPVKPVKASKKITPQVKDEVKKSGTRKFRFKEFGRGRIVDDEEVAEEKEGLVTDSITTVRKK